MERLTKVINACGKTVVVYTRGKYEDTTTGEMRHEDIRNVMRRLSDYEDTGLTPEQIRELKERDTAKAPEEHDGHWYKILEEIDETIERYGENPYIDGKVTDICYGLNIAKDIIRKHMNDGWIPVERGLPPNAKHEGEFCPKYQVMTKYGVTEGWYNPDEEGWYVLIWFMTERYKDSEVDLDMGDVPKVVFLPDEVNNARHILTAWHPLPEPYRQETETEKPDWRQDMLKKFDRRD